MKHFQCYHCDTEFASDSETPSCPSCGCPWTLVASSSEIVQPAPSGEAEIGGKSLVAVRGVLRGLCERTYDLSYGSAEWDQALDKALEELSLYLKAA